MSSIDLLAAARTEQDLQVEMVRMCVAEAGYDPSLIRASEVEGFSFTSDPSFPPEVCWKARELVGIGEPKCFECTSLDRYAHAVVRRCRSVQRLELDCGAPMPDPP